MGDATRSLRVTHTLNRAVLVYPERLAVIDGATRKTWRELGDRVPRLAGALRERGIGCDDKVAILALNSYRYFELYFATMWAGGVVVPLNFRLAPPELIHQINESEAKVLCVDETFAAMLPAFAGNMPAIKHIVLMKSGDDAPAGCVPYEAALQAGEPCADALRGDDDVAGIFYTGGTTGRAKGVMLSHGNLMANAQNGLLANHGSFRDIYLHCAPMFHLADISSTFGLTMIGATHSFLPFYEPVALMQAIQEYRVSLVVMIPTMLNMVINHPRFSEFDLSSLRCVLYGASPMPLAVLQKALQVLPCDYIQGYGMTELSPLVTMLPPADHVDLDTPERQRHLKSAGFPLFTAEVKVLDDEDREVPYGTVGEICARGPMVMQGYWKQPDATAQALRNGWMHTGDAGYMEPDGYLYLVDRTKDMIVSGGENVYSTEVEAALYDHPAVLEAAVIGIPHEVWGEAVHAIVVCRTGHVVTAEELFEHCHARIANYKCPKSVDFHASELPKSGAGKILKRELRKPFWESHERMIN
ncbi:MAG: long-chain fatty acid--CoA ligase [Pirellulales bacterium]|nr:long-chain fatty acid--CoA ligase [Pirellulales bacterium]